MISLWFGVLEFSYSGGGGGGGIPFSNVNVHVKTSILFSIRGESTTENDYKPLNQPWIHLKDPLKWKH